MRRQWWIASVSVVLALAGAVSGCSSGGLAAHGEEQSVEVHDELLPGPATDLTDTSGGAGRSGAAGAPGDSPGTASTQYGGSPNRLGSASVPVRVYEPQAGDSEEPWATLVWAHGGSFVRGSLDWPEADWVARAFAEAGVRVYSVDYALASDTVKAPAPANDVAAVLREVSARHDGLLIVGGASAGAHLAALATLTQADGATSAGTGDSAQSTLASPPSGVRAADALLMLYPTAHRVQRPDPQIAELTAALPETRRFDASRIAQMYAYYLGDGSRTEREPETATDIGAGPGLVSSQAGRADPLAYPMTPTVIGELPPERLRQLPPTIIVNADADELRASGEQFAEQLRAASVPVTITLQPGTVHGYLNRPVESGRAQADARATIDRFVAELRAIHSE